MYVLVSYNEKKTHHTDRVSLSALNNICNTVSINPITKKTRAILLHLHKYNRICHTKSSHQSIESCILTLNPNSI